MTTYEITGEFATTPEKYWEMFFDDAYNDALWPFLAIGREQLKLERQGTGDGEVITRVQRLTPERELPGFMQKVVSGAVAYTETNVFHRATSLMEVKTEPSYLSDKILASGTYEVRPKGDKGCVRIWKARCDCKLMLVGKKIEEHIIEEVRRSYAKTTSFTHEWLRKAST